MIPRPGMLGESQLSWPLTSPDSLKSKYAKMATQHSIHPGCVLITHPRSKFTVEEGGGTRPQLWPTLSLTCYMTLVFAFSRGMMLTSDSQLCRDHGFFRMADQFLHPQTVVGDAVWIVGIDRLTHHASGRDERGPTGKEPPTSCLLKGKFINHPNLTPICKEGRGV